MSGTNPIRHDAGPKVLVGIHRNAQYRHYLQRVAFGLIRTEGHLNPCLIGGQLHLVGLVDLVGSVDFKLRLDLLEVIRHTIQGQLGQQVVATEVLVQTSTGSLSAWRACWLLDIVFDLL